MIGRLSGFLGGERRYLICTAPQVGATLFLQTDIPCFKGKAVTEGYEVSIERKYASTLEGLLQKRGIPYRLLYEKGLVPFLFKALARPGLLFGMLLAFFLIYQSSQYVWDIRISGNETLSDEQVEDILDEYGFYIGCRYDSVDLHRFCNLLPMERQDIAWISVNMMGSVAEVQIIENIPKPPKEEPKEGLFNLVAKREGQIVRYDLSTGRVVVPVGSTVKKGQLLVAGFSEKDSGLHPKVSSGRVLAKVWLYEQVFIPFEQTERVEKKEIELEKSVKILGKEIIFFKNSRFLEEKYDTIDDEYYPTVFGIALPFRIRVRYALPYEEEVRTVSEAEAVKLAQQQLSEKINGVSEELLFREYEITKKKDGVTVLCKALCITDIARQVEVTTDEEKSP